MVADYNPKISNMESDNSGDNNESSILNYDERRLDLVLDRVVDITRDRIVPFKESLVGLELHACQEMHKRQIFHIEGGASGPIFERPSLNKSNYQKSQAYQEYIKLINDSINISNPELFSQNLPEFSKEVKKRVEMQKP
jgi:hypothetical protein